MEGAKYEINIMSQWAIDGVGRSRAIFQSLKKAVDRKVKLRLLFNVHSDAQLDTGYAPFDLKRHENHAGQVV